MKIETKIGLIDIKDLEVTDEITLEDNARIFKTSWICDGILVRQDVNVNILRGISLTAKQEQ